MPNRLPLPLQFLWLLDGPPLPCIKLVGADEAAPCIASAQFHAHSLLKGCAILQACTRYLPEPAQVALSCTWVLRVAQVLRQGCSIALPRDGCSLCAAYCCLCCKTNASVVCLGKQPPLRACMPSINHPGCSCLDDNHNQRPTGRKATQRVCHCVVHTGP